MWSQRWSSPLLSRRLFTRAEPSRVLSRPSTSKEPRALPKTWGIFHVWHEYRRRGLDEAFGHHHFHRGDVWSPAFTEPDFRTALSRLSSVTQETHLQDSSKNSDRPPLWVLLRIIRDKVKTQQDAHSVALLAHELLPSLSPAVKPCVLVMAAHWNAQFYSNPPLHRLTNTFLSLDPDPPTYQYNLLLHALTAGRSKLGLVESHIVHFLNAMQLRNHPVFSDTYLRLLSSCTTVNFLKAIVRHMKGQGFSPKKKHLELLTAIAARNGDPELSRNFLIQKHRRKRELESGETDGLREAFKLRPAGRFDPLPVTPFDQNYLMTFPRHTKLRQWMDPLAKSNGILHVSARSPNSGGRSVGAPAPDKAEHLVPGEWQDKSTPPLSTTTLDWRHVLQIAGRDKSIPSEKLLILLRRLITNTDMHPRAAISCYTTVLQGLIIRGEYPKALELWKEIVELDLPIDSIALTVGVQALTMGGEPASAVHLLDQVHRSRLQLEKGLEAHRVRGFSKSLMLSKQVNLSGYQLNSFLSALSRTGYTDAVILIWNNLDLLWGVGHDTYTFSVLLECGRWCKTYNDTVRGALASLNARFSLKSSWSPEDELTDPRERVLEKLRRILRSPPQATGMWGDQPGHRVALQIATQVFLWNRPELAQVKYPVRALRTKSNSPSARPMSELYRAMVSYRKSQRDNHPSLLIELAGEAPPVLQYASVHPDDKVFRRYIRLLAFNDLHHEIPIALAWMRKLDVRPSKLTISVSLGYWQQVSMDAPLIEAMRGGGELGPYEGLKQWLREWVGVKDMPDERDELECGGRTDFERK